MQETIRLSALGRQFQRGDMAVQALDDIDLTIQSGEFVALVGPSGSGKSTLLNLLGGLDRPSSGGLWVDGVPLHTAGEKERTDHRRRHVGFIFQSFNLLPRLTALENVAVPLMLSGVERAQREERAAEMLRQVGLEHRLRHYPSEMSGGEQQRTAVARALIHKPALVLADEPTGNLDSKTGAEVMDLLHTLNEEQDITLVVVTHDADVAAYAGRTVHLRDGQIAEITQKKTAAPVPRPQGEDHEAALPNDPGRLRAADILHSAFRNLGRRPVRNLLTAGGVLIGIITLVAMVSFGVGVQREVQRNFATIGLENIFVRPRFAEGDGFDPFADFEAATPITPAIVDEIRELPQVASVTPELALPQSLDITITVGDQSLPVRVSDSFGEARFSFGARNEPLAGASFAEGNSAGVVLVAGLADSLLLEGQTYEDLVGAPATFVLQLPRGETQEFTSSIVSVRDSFGRRTVDLGLAERAAMKAWWFGQPDIVEMEGYDALTVKATDLAYVPDLIEGIEELDLQTQSLEAVLNVANQVLTLLQVLLGSVGGLALLVAALGVANTMMMAIYERTREIGVLKALGAARGEIRAMFTVEAAFIGLIGGFFGLIFGALLGRLADWIAHRYLISEGVTGVGDLSVIPPWLALGSLVFATLIGILAGLYPAARAARLDPVAALRHE
jgi:ABC-type lipoprotein export system ATPase subunit/ABC-type lipoprotein release transport system permease subunit